MRILLVDDDALLREMYATKFTEGGHSVEAIGNGERALELLQEEQFDVILFDMVMPSITGDELLVKINALALPKKPKCIVLSNQGEESDITKAMEAGASGYIVKAQLIPSEVVKKVEEIVSA